MNFIIRKANQDDMHDVLNLIKELALFEKEPDEVEISTEELVKDGFGKEKNFRCLVALVIPSISSVISLFTKILKA